MSELYTASLFVRETYPTVRVKGLGNLVDCVIDTCAKVPMWHGTVEQLKSLFPFSWKSYDVWYSMVQPDGDTIDTAVYVVPELTLAGSQPEAITLHNTPVCIDDSEELEHPYITLNAGILDNMTVMFDKANCMLRISCNNIHAQHRLPSMDDNTLTYVTFVTYEQYRDLCVTRDEIEWHCTANHKSTHDMYRQLFNTVPQALRDTESISSMQLIDAAWKDYKVQLFRE